MWFELGEWVMEDQILFVCIYMQFPVWYVCLDTGQIFHKPKCNFLSEALSTMTLHKDATLMRLFHISRLFLCLPFQDTFACISSGIVSVHIVLLIITTWHTLRFGLVATFRVSPVFRQRNHMFIPPKRSPTTKTFPFIPVNWILNKIAKFTTSTDCHYISLPT